jgi:hypothetical protein
MARSGGEAATSVVQRVYSSGAKLAMQNALYPSGPSSAQRNILNGIIARAEAIAALGVSNIETMVQSLVTSGRLDNPAGLVNLLQQILVAASNENPQAARDNSVGFIYELFYALQQASAGFRVQLGAIDGVGGDIVLTDSDGNVTTIHLKYITGTGLKNVKTRIREAMRQFSGAGGETPAQGSKRKVMVVIENTDNALAKVRPKKQAKAILAIINGTPLNQHTDEVEVHVNDPDGESYWQHTFTAD